MKKAIIVGASSGIGMELTRVLAKEGYALGICGRRVHLLEQLQNELPTKTLIQAIDITDPEALGQLRELIEHMQGVDLIVISSGTGHIDPEIPWQKEKETIDTNVLGFSAMANVAWQHFKQQGSGHLVGISSIAAIRGGEAPAYNASKAFVSNYLQGLRYHAGKSGLPITITDIQPGFVDTAMAQGEGLFWVASPSKAAHQIYAAIRKKRKHAYITKRWRLIAWMMRWMPDVVYNRLS